MKRVFPTQLRVVDNRAELNPVDEAKKGYYDVNSKNTIRVGVRGRSAIYLSSPGNWYRYYVFTILNIPELSKIHFADEGEDVVEEDNREKNVQHPVVVKSDDYDVWRIVSQLIKTECGRKVIHHPGQKYVTLAGINKDMAKQFYYLTKHTLTKMGVEFRLTYALFSPFGSATPPDVREKPKRKRQKKGGPPQQQPWVTVGKLENHMNC